MEQIFETLDTFVHNLQNSQNLEQHQQQLQLPPLPPPEYHQIRRTHIVYSSTGSHVMKGSTNNNLRIKIEQEEEPYSSPQNEYDYDYEYEYENENENENEEFEEEERYLPTWEEATRGMNLNRTNNVVVKETQSFQTFRWHEKKGTRTRTTPEQARILLDAFNKNQCPSRKERQQLSLQTKMTPRKIQIWFQNKRTSLRKSPNFNPTFNVNPTPSKKSSSSLPPPQPTYSTNNHQHAFNDPTVDHFFSLYEESSDDIDSFPNSPLDSPISPIVPTVDQTFPFLTPPISPTSPPPDFPCFTNFEFPTS